MQEELDAANAQLAEVAQHIRNGDVHPDPDWSWEIQLTCLEHDTAVLEFAVEKGYTDFNTAASAYIDMICK